MKRKWIFLFLTVLIPSFIYAQEREEKRQDELPSIRISSLKILSPQAKPRDSCFIEVTINNGSSAASGFFDVLLIAGDQLIGQRKIDLHANEELKMRFSWFIPKTGTYNIKAVADPEGTLHEIDRSDNTKELGVTVTENGIKQLSALNSDAPLVQAMDISCLNISVHGHVFQADKKRLVTINFQIRNNSAIAESRSFRTRITITPDSAGTVRDFFITTRGIKPGQIVYVSQSVENAPHRFRISIKVDADNVIAESNKQNNLGETFYENPVGPVDRWISAGPDYISGVNNVGYPWGFATGVLNELAINSRSPDTMYVGGFKCGIWKTGDAGLSWFPLTDQISLNVATIAISPQNPDILYFATQHEGVYRTGDGGVSWVHLTTQDLNVGAFDSKMVIHPQDPNLIFLTSPSGVYRSPDGGVSWNLVQSGLVTGIEISNINSNIVYAAIQSTTAGIAGIYGSPDKGLTWKRLPGCPGGQLPSDLTATTINIAQTTDRLFATFRTGSTFKVYRTTTTACSVGGVPDRSWEAVWSVSGADVSDLWGSNFWANPNDNTRLYLGGTYFWRSENAGVSFEKVSTYGSPSGSAHTDNHGFASRPGQKDVIYSLDDGGIYKSEKDGQPGSWTFIGQGIANVEFYGFANALLNPSLIIGGTQDNGILKSTGDLTWQAKRGGDGAMVDIDNANPNIMYSLGQQSSDLQRSANAGDSWSGSAGGLPVDNACPYMQFMIHPRQSNILIGSCAQLWRSVNSGGSWQAIFTPPDGSISFSTIDGASDTYFAGTSRGKLFAGPGGSNFQQIFSHPLLAGINDIEIDPSNPDVFIACGGAGSGRVFQLKTTGPGSFDNADITNNLPANLTVQCLAIDRMNAFTIYAGTQKGIYRGKSSDAGLTWQWSPYSEGLPFADIRDLRVHPFTGVMLACTFGRGIYEVATGPPIGSVLALDGKITFMRVHDVGTGYGPPGDFLDAELIVRLDTSPSDYFGITLRPDAGETDHRSIEESIRAAFEDNKTVRIEYTRTGIHSGTIIRVIQQ